MISKGEVYVSDILNILTEANLLTVEGTLYPLLSRLKKGELLQYRWEESPHGPPRKYFSLTEKGREALSQNQAEWEAIVKSINFLSNK